MSLPAGVWYPSDLAPHMYYISGTLSGMATALRRQRGSIQKWEAFDMRTQNAEGTGAIFLGEHESVESAKHQIELMVTK